MFFSPKTIRAEHNEKTEPSFFLRVIYRQL